MCSSICFNVYASKLPSFIIYDPVIQANKPHHVDSVYRLQGSLLCVFPSVIVCSDTPKSRRDGEIILFYQQRLRIVIAEHVSQPV